MKNILFISPDTFGYHKAISAAIAKKGFNPIWLNQLPSVGVASRVFFRLAPRIASHLATSYFLREIDKINNLHMILIIKGEGVSDVVLAHMRERYPEAKIIYYLWDSLANVSGAERKIGLCDAAYSFDPVDCEEIGGLKHLPLFHTKQPGPNNYRPGFAAFIGTLHSNRYQLIRKIANKVERITRITPFLYFYYPNATLLLILKLTKKTFRQVRWADIHFEPLDREQYGVMNSEAEIAIDICHPKQSGLTMRSIEALCEGKKLITNNKAVRRYALFQPDRCYVVDGELDADFEKFLNSPSQPQPAEVLAKYHIDSWLQPLLQGPAKQDTA